MKNLIFTQTENRRMIGVTARQLLIWVCFVAFTCAGFAQDLIVTRDSRRIEAKVTEISADNVKYKMFDNQDGPVYTVAKSNVLTIVFQNGQVETFDAQPPATTATPTQSTAVRTQTTPTSTQSTQTFAQTVPTQQRTQFGRRLTTAETLAEMQINYPALYSQYNAGRKMRSIGWGLTGAGLGALIIGAAISVDGEETANEEQEAGGLLISTAGVIMAGAGVTVLAIGGGKRRRALNAFNMQYYTQEQPASQFQLNLYPNRIGLAYVF